MNHARTLLRAATCAALTTFIAAPAASAAAPATGENTPLSLPSPSIGTHSNSSSSSLVRTIVGLLIVIAVIYGLTWVLKQVKTGKDERAAGTGLASLATLPLGTNRAVHLIRSGGEYLLIGVADQGITPLRRYTEEQAIELGLLNQEDGDDADGGTPTRTIAGTAAALGRMVRGDGGDSVVERVRNFTVRS